jgi:uncharacterized RDD family membrane protein YckC
MSDAARPRWSQTWLSGVPSDTAPGVRLGLPESGPGSACTWGRRIGAFAIASVAANLVAAAFVQDAAARGLWVTAAFALEVFLLVALTGQSIGMRLAGVRVARLDGGTPVGLGASAIRTALLCLLVPAVIYDRDRRGMHDRASGTVVVRA